MDPKVSHVIALLLISSFPACLDSEEEKKFTWPEKQDSVCEITNLESVTCMILLEDFKTPITSSINEESNQLWIADLSGEIRSWDGNNDNLVGNLTEYVSKCHHEQGLLGMVFSHNFTNDGKLLLSYVAEQNCDGQFAAPLVLADVSVENGILNLSTLRILTEIEQPFRNHNAGHLLSVGDGQYLWGIGDGGGSNDPNGNGQNASSALSSIYLFEYDGSQISPVLKDPNGLDSFILHTGLRNPWKFDLDNNKGLWIADVGQYCFEEVNYIEVWNESSNFGWSLREGKHSFSPDSDCPVGTTNPPDGITDPVIEYGHSNGQCSITGGFWMDSSFPMGEGYLYGDFCTGSVWLAEKNNNTLVERLLFDTDLQIVGFGKGLDDELLIFHWSGSIFEIIIDEVMNEF